MRPSKSFVIAILICLPIVIGVARYGLLNTSSFNASAAMADGQVGIYWDKTCTKRVGLIEWGTLAPDTTKEISVYVRNEGTILSVLLVASANWNPVSSSAYLQYSWTCSDNKLSPSEVVQVKNVLKVSKNIKGVSNFSFDIMFNGNTGLPIWDLNQDGKIDVMDVTIVGRSFGSTPTSPKWDPRGDVNSNKIIDIRDISAVTTHYGDHYT